MKIVAVGIGQCGCNIADNLYGANKHSKTYRGIKILVDAFAINTAIADLRQLKHIPDDSHHRIRVGEMETFGHGVGKVNQVAAEIFERECDIIVSTITKSEKFYQAEAYVVIASGGGGTGSGGISRIVQGLKEKLIEEKPVYGMVILPFRHDEEEKNPLAVLNTATCVSTLYEVADAVILVDNQRFVEIDRSLSGKMEAINTRIAETFYDLFCAGEEEKRKYIGRKVMEAGDIKECIKGLTTIGLGHTKLSTLRSLRQGLGGSHYLEDAEENARVLGSLGQAIEKLCVKCDLTEAGRVGCLICAPQDTINEAMIGAMKKFLSKLSPEALIRMGDYPRRAFDITITLIVGELGRVQRIEDLYDQAKDILKNMSDLEERKQAQREQVIKRGEGLPKLL